MVKGLFINVGKATCSISESGEMIYNCLKDLDMDYIEVNKQNHIIKDDYDFYAFNYHILRMNWLKLSELNNVPGLKIAFVLEVKPQDPFVMIPVDAFDAYCVLDPTINIPDKRIYAFPRPLERTEVQPYIGVGTPVVGTFGFLTQGKGYATVVEAVANEFNQAIVRINVPRGQFVEPLWKHTQKVKDLRKQCDAVKHDGVTVIITENYMTKQGLIDWCSQNTLNCFLYDRDLPGLCATCDQAIISGRPLAVSDNETFRHIHRYLKPYPQWSLKDSIRLSQIPVKQMQQDWSPEIFKNRFKRMLNNFEFSRIPTGKEISLPRVNEVTLLRWKLQNAAQWRYKQARKLLSF